VLGVSTRGKTIANMCDDITLEETLVTCPECRETAQVTVPSEKMLEVIDEYLLKGLQDIQLEEVKKLNDYKEKKHQLICEAQKVFESIWGNYKSDLKPIDEQQGQMIDDQYNQQWPIQEAKLDGESEDCVKSDRQALIDRITEEVCHILQTKRDELHKKAVDLIVQTTKQLNQQLRAADDKFLEIMQKHVDHLRGAKEWSLVVRELLDDENKKDGDVTTCMKIFFCSNLECMGAKCLNCKRSLRKAGSPRHVCEPTPEDQLYSHVLRVLVSYVRTSPICGIPAPTSQDSFGYCGKTENDPANSSCPLMIDESSWVRFNVTCNYMRSQKSRRQPLRLSGIK
jgi:hypothetical protein